MFKVVVKEDKLDELLKEIQELDINTSECLDYTFYENTFYTVGINFENKTYIVKESCIQEKIIGTRYTGGVFLDYIPSYKYYLKNKTENNSSYVEVITLNNLLESSLRELGFTLNEINLLSKDVVVNNYFNASIESRVDKTYLPYETLEEVYNNIIKEKELYELFIEYRRKTHELSRVRQKITKSSEAPIEPLTTEFNDKMNHEDFIKKIIYMLDENYDNVKFKVETKDAILNIVRFLSEEGYSYSFQNTNEETTQYNLGIRHGSIEVLFNNRYFHTQNFSYYKNKVFNIDFYNKKLSFWEEPERVGDKTEEQSRKAIKVQ